MTVSELIEELKKHPGEMPVKLLYDSAVMVADVDLVALHTDRIETYGKFVALADSSSVYESADWLGSYD